MTPSNGVSYDDSYKLMKLTATGVTPSVTKTSVGTLNQRRVSASVWLKADSANPPGTVTLTLSDGADNQVVSETITVDENLRRFGIAGYFTNVSSTVKLKVSWTSTTGVLWCDQWQAEDNDWPSETIVNNSTTAPQARTVFVDPLRVMGVAPYAYNQQITWSDMLYNDSGLYPADYQASPSDSRTRWVSVNGGTINLKNIAAGTHLLYRAKKLPPTYDTNSTGSEIIQIPEPELWTVIRGAVAYQKAAAYDSGSNSEVTRAMAAFGAAVEDMVMSSRTNPSWSFVNVLAPRMT